MDATPPADGPPAAITSSARGWDPNGWLVTVLLGVALAAAYLANGREIGTYDTIPTALTALTLARGEGIHLDRFAPLLRESDGRLSPYVERTRGHLISRYPLAPAILAAPLVAPQLAWFDARYPGWRERPDASWAVAQLTAKHAAAILAALAGATIYRVLRGLDLGRHALPATLGAALGTDLWTVASQALWQHGPAALLLGVLLILIAPANPSRGRWILAGLAAGLMIACRVSDAVFVAPILGWLTFKRGRAVLDFGIGLIGPVALMGLGNLLYFGTWMGGLDALEAMHPELHGVGSTWSGHLGEGLAGTLVSPSRGLLVFSPWVAISVVLAPWTLRRLRPWPLVRVVLVTGLLLNMLVLSKYVVWWAGHTFGPRYWTDATPLLAVLLGLGLAWTGRFRVAIRALFILTITVSIAFQVIGAFCYPSSWNLSPTNVDRDHARLWDWRDTELRRCVIEALESRGR